MTKILIAGCGYVGAALGAHLSESNCTVWGLRRGDGPLPTGIRPLLGDLVDPATFESVPTDIDFAVFCASAGEATRIAYQRIYVEGLQNLLLHLARCPQLKHVFFLSSTSVYGQTDGSWVDEDSPTEPKHFSGEVTLRAEQLLAQSKFSTTALRCAGIYGPTRTRLIDAVRTGSATLPISPNFTNRIHRDDIAGAVAHLIASRTALPNRLLLSDDDPAAYDTLLNHLADELDCARPLVNPSAPALRRGGNKHCRNQRLKDLGYQLKYPSFRDGYRELLQH